MMLSYLKKKKKTVITKEIICLYKILFHSKSRLQLMLISGFFLQGIYGKR